MIIRNPLGSNNVAKTAHNVPAAKECDICTTAFKQGRDDFRINHCNDCVTTNKVANSKFWKDKFSQDRLNSLSPEQLRLAEQLGQFRELLEGRGIHREAQIVQSRSMDDVRQDQAKYAANLENVRAQVVEMLPAVLAEYGLAKAYDIEIIADLLVPARINTPIALNANAKSALRSAVFEALEFLDADKLIVQAGIKPNGNVKTVAAQDMILDGGIRRVGDSYGSHIRSIPKIAAVTESEEGALENLRHDMHTQDAVRDAEAVPMDEQEALAQTEQAPQEEMPPMPNEGIAPVGHGAVNDAPEGDLSQLAYEGIRRIQQAVAPKARPIPNATAKIEKPKYAEMFTFAGRVPKEVPVTAIKLEKYARQIINAHTPINYVTAQYSDSNTRTFSYYKTDVGYLFESANSTHSFHSKNVRAFLDFIQTDPQFVRWAFLPPTPDVQPEAPKHNLEEVAEIPHDGQFEVEEFDVEPIGEGMGADPGFNDAPVHSLTPSNNNQVDQNGLMFENTELFDNPAEGFAEAPEDIELEPTMPQHDEELLQHTAAQMLPHVEAMFPNEPFEVQADMAITAALEVIAATYTSDPQNMKPAFKPQKPATTVSVDDVAKSLKNAPMSNSPSTPGTEMARQTTTPQPEFKTKEAPQKDKSSLQVMEDMGKGIAPPANHPFAQNELRKVIKDKGFIPSQGNPLPVVNKETGKPANLDKAETVPTAPVPGARIAPTRYDRGLSDKGSNDKGGKTYEHAVREMEHPTKTVQDKETGQHSPATMRRDVFTNNEGNPVGEGADYFKEDRSIGNKVERQKGKNLLENPSPRYKNQRVENDTYNVPTEENFKLPNEDSPVDVITPADKINKLDREKALKEKFHAEPFGEGETPVYHENGVPKRYDIDGASPYGQAPQATEGEIPDEMGRKQTLDRMTDPGYLKTQIRQLERRLDPSMYEGGEEDPEYKQKSQQLKHFQDRLENLYNKSDTAQFPELSADDNVRQQHEAIDPETQNFRGQREKKRRDDHGSRSLYDEQAKNVKVSPHEEDDDNEGWQPEPEDEGVEELNAKDKYVKPRGDEDARLDEIEEPAKKDIKDAPKSDVADKSIRNKKTEQEKSKKKTTKKDDVSQKVEAIAKHLNFVTANAKTASDVNFGIQTLIEAGFHIDDIIEAQASLNKIAEGDGNESGATHAVKDVAETFGEADEDAKHGLHNSKSFTTPKVEQKKNNPLD